MNGNDEKAYVARRDVLLREPTVSISRCREGAMHLVTKPTWPVLGGDRAVRSHRVEQFTALWGL